MVIEGMPAAGPPAMALPTPVTDPGVQCNAIELPPAGTKLTVNSGVPPARLVASEKGATGTSSGTSTNATSESASVATTEAVSILPSAPTMATWLAPATTSAVVAMRPPSATATPISATVPCAVVTCNSTMERPAVSTTSGTD